ncbi:uncharacterized protein LOC135503583 [Lineus longissimus]|uniref:uncharacterized protein LOC135503583 n=1 Tax=Lineus longissimus TaxID=88925 RepID=UPI00315D4A7D
MSNGMPPPYSDHPIQQGPQVQRIIIIPRQNAARQTRLCGGLAIICCLPFQMIACCFGLKPKMERVNRLVISFFTFAAIALAAGLLLAFVTYGSDEFEASPADMRPMDRKFSSNLCSRFEVTKSNAPVDVYFFDKTPPIRQHFHKNYVIEVDPQNIDSKHWEMINFYMLKGSRLEVQTHASLTFPSVEVYVIKGSYNLGEWIGDQDCCYLKKDSSSSFGWSYFDYNITETDEYYITMAIADFGFISGGSSATVNAKFGLQKTMYDWREATYVCANYTDGGCGVDLTFGSEQMALVYAPGRDLDGALVKKYQIETVCKPRIAIYVPCFLLVPLVAYALWALMLWCRYSDKSASTSGSEANPAQAQVVSTHDQAQLVPNQVL